MYEMIDRSALKAKARELMRSAKVSPVKMSLLQLGIIFVMVLALIIGFAGCLIAFGLDDEAVALPALFLVILLTLIDTVLSAGYICYCLGVWKGEKMPYSSLFDGFSFAGKVIGLQLVTALFVYLWSLLFVIPGIVAIYRYSFAMYNLCQNPELGVMEALRLSKQQTNGYKMQLFTLQLSFFGWALLAAIPQSIGQAFQQAEPSSLSAIVLSLVLSLVTLCANIFLMPYMQLSYAGFYLQATAPQAEQEPFDDPFGPL